MRAEGAAGYLIGFAFLLAVLVPCGLAAHVVVRRRVGHLRGLVRGLALFVVGTAAVWAVHVVPGIAGLLTPWAVIACAVLLLVGALRLPAVRGVPDAAPSRTYDPIASRVLAAAGAAAAAVVTLTLILGPGPEPLGVDMAGNHMPQIARWIQNGSMWQLTGYAPYLAHATYPQSANVLLLAVTLPWHSAFAAGYVPPLFMAITALAVFALAREIGAPRSSSALAAAAVVALPAVSVFVLREVVVDVVELAWFSAGALFLLRATRRGDTRELALAGCALGLAFGTKWYAVPHVALLFAVWLVARRGRGRGVGREAALLAGLIALFGGVWLVRNWVLAGNPLHPLRISVLGVTILDAPRDLVRELFGFTIWDYRDDPGVVRHVIVPAWLQAFGLLGPLLLAAAAAAAARSARPRVVLTVAGTTITLGFMYLVTPDTAFGLKGAPTLVFANSRYAVPALLGGAALAAWTCGHAGRARTLLEALLLVALLDALRRMRSFGQSEDLALAVVLVAAAAAALLLWRRRPAARLMPAVAVAATAAAVFGGWRAWQADHWRDYGGRDGAIAAMQAAAPADSRVGLIGQLPGELPTVLPAFGRRLDNRVDFFGRIVRGTLLPRSDRSSFARWLQAGRYDVLLVGKRPYESAPISTRPELGWAREHGYREIGSSPLLVALARP